LNRTECVGCASSSVSDRKEVSGTANADAAVLDPDVFGSMLRFTHMSIAKTNPDITADDLENALTLGDFTELFQAVMNVSGMSGNSNQGEALRQPRLNKAGDTSTGLLPPEPAGHIDISTPS